MPGVTLNTTFDPDTGRVSYVISCRHERGRGWTLLEESPQALVRRLSLMGALCGCIERAMLMRERTN